MAVVNQVGNALTGSTGTGSFVGSAAPTFTGIPILAAPSATSITFSSTSGIIGTTTNDNAAAGSVGEFVSATYGPTGLTSTSTVNATSLSLTAGDWDVWGSAFFIVGDGTTLITIAQGGINTTTATLPTTALRSYYGPGSGTNISLSLAIPAQRISISGTTTVYLVVNSAFTVSTLAVSGFMYARRIR